MSSSTNEPGVVVWFTGRPSSGKSTLARAVYAKLREEPQLSVCVLDGDEVRAALVPTPGYTGNERAAFYETLANLAALLAAQGQVVLVAATAGERAFRDRARQKASTFVEVYLDVPLEECVRRDAKGLYASSKEHRVFGLPGFDAPYEPPYAPELTTNGVDDGSSVARIVELVLAKVAPGR
jgi:adenylylsulfate kinase